MQLDEMLLQSIKEWETTMSAENTTRAILSLVVFVANSLLLQKALLFPWVCHVFLDAYGVQHQIH